MWGSETFQKGNVLHILFKTFVKFYIKRSLIYHFILQLRNPCDNWHSIPDTSLSVFTLSLSIDSSEVLSVWFFIFDLICLRAKKVLSYTHVLLNSNDISWENLSSLGKFSFEISVQNFQGHRTFQSGRVDLSGNHKFKSIKKKLTWPKSFEKI